MSMNFAFVMWDWKGKPDIEEINTALQAVYDGNNCPGVTLLPDSGRDDGVAVISSQTITTEIAQRVWESFALDEQPGYESYSEPITLDEGVYGA